MEIWTLLLATVAGAVGIYYFFFRDRDVFKKAGVPHISPIPLLGNMAPVVLRRISMSEQVNKVYNLNSEAKYAGLYDFDSPVVMIRDPELIKSIGVKHFENFPHHRALVDESQEPLFSRNLFVLRGEKWKDMRTLLSPAFTSNKMRTMLKLMSNCAESFAEYWLKEPAESNCAEMKDAFSRYTNDVIATCAFGIGVDSIRNRDNRFYVLGRKTTDFGGFRSLQIFFNRCFPTFCRALKLRLFSKEAEDFFMNLIDSTIRTRDEKKITRPDMIQLMMESRGKRNDNELTIEEMTAQAFIFFFGGFESTSTLMCFAAHEIAMNPDIQSKLQAEIDEILEETNGELTYEALNKAKYMDAVLNEALRLYPVAIFADRTCVKDFQLPPTLPNAKPFTVKKGSSVWFPIYGLHRDPKHFYEPDKFIPDRFLDENKHNINLSAYLPFGLGPRMCIGNRFALMETKVMLFHLLSRCYFKPCEKTPNPLVISKKNFSISPEGGFWLKIKPRSTPSTNLTNLTNGNSAVH